MKKMHISLTLFILFGFVLNNIALSWDDKVTHKDLSQFAAENSVLSKTKGDYLKNLGFERGVKEPLKWNATKTILDWLREGAELEDKQAPYFPILGTTRSYNHFHNPLKLWTQAGLNDFWTGESSLLWAQDGANQQNFPEKDWSWKKIREYYYIALTGRDFTGTVVAPDKTKREEYFARTSRGLGHQMHLIQDAAQPDHVRNDAHPEDTFSGVGTPIGFEKWAKKNQSFINSLALNPIFPTLSLNPSQYTLDPSYSTRNLTPSALFLDTDQYDGLNASAGINQGLAEYTNANFFSDDTIFAVESYSTDHKHYFPYPKKSSTDLQSYIDQNKLPKVVIGEDNIPDTSFWIKKERDGEFIEHFVRPGYFTKYINPFISLYHRTFYRDEKCHEDYASLLIPRAVGYSAGLLNYFFRGNIEITLPNTGVYSLISADKTGFTSINLLAKNTTSTGEDMNDGSIELVVKYKLAIQDPFQSSPVSTTNDFSYIVIPEASNRRSIPKDTPVELTFDLTANPVPLWATDIYLQVVYKGKFGREDGAVAVGFKDISEPTPVDIFNNTDKICLYGAWYNAGSPEAIAQVDTDHNGIPEWDIYPHNPTNSYIRFSSAANPQNASSTVYNYAVSNPSAGASLRALYILSDYQFSYSNYTTWAKQDNLGLWTHVSATYLHSGTAIKNQTEYYPVFHNFRSTDIWGGAGIIYINSPYPSNSECS
ncbi:MAG: hypothetical protein HY756_12495 [Nitrospirae bacterium]|nr:hypothetical protein [Nitrospirota bacterium]